MEYVAEYVDSDHDGENGSRIDWYLVERVGASDTLSEIGVAIQDDGHRTFLNENGEPIHDGHTVIGSPRMVMALHRAVDAANARA